MPRLALLDPTKTGRQAEDLENKLRRLVVGQDDAIHQIVRAYQTHEAGLSSGQPDRSETFCSWGLRAPENSHRRGHRRVSAKRFSIGNQDRLRGVSTQP